MTIKNGTLVLILILGVVTSLALPVKVIPHQVNEILDTVPSVAKLPPKTTQISASTSSNDLKHTINHPRLVEGQAHLKSQSRRKSRQQNNMPFIIYGGCSPYGSSMLGGYPGVQRMWPPTWPQQRGLHNLFGIGRPRGNQRLAETVGAVLPALEDLLGTVILHR
ncbi:uncharacterized protein LOC110841785 [Folsomia candida]|uniref:uncharacterized protein LOC110841785 n=1 Tax=Folsomia candida TaxID=158441 RepID=UPI000B90151C|nr:uncharacterized protein LOC110841785 [Folsomia candida]